MDSMNWMDILALSDAYGFRPSSPTWKEAVETMDHVEGKGNNYWWTAGSNWILSFDEAESSRLANTLSAAESENYVTVKGELLDALPISQQESIKLVLGSLLHLVGPVIRLAESGPVCWNHVTHYRGPFALRRCESEAGGRVGG